MNIKIRLLSISMALALFASMLSAGTAFAGSKGRRNTAIGLGAVTVHQALKGKTTNAIIAGAGTAYAYKRYKDARNAEKRRERRRAAYYSRRYR